MSKNVIEKKREENRSQVGSSLYDLFVCMEHNSI